MQHINIEIKAKCFYPQKVEAFLLQNNAVFHGTDFQKDIYFHVPKGRLKLRRGNIENNLIYYKRNNQKGPKQSDFNLMPVTEPEKLELLLTQALGVQIIVEKKRKIFFLGNIKIHLDEVPGLGNFVEIEAGNIHSPEIPVAKLRHQCKELMEHLDISVQDLIENSYSDMLLAKKE